MTDLAFEKQKAIKYISRFFDLKMAEYKAKIEIIKHEARIRNRLDKVRMSAASQALATEKTETAKRKFKDRICFNNED